MPQQAIDVTPNSFFCALAIIYRDYAHFQSWSSSLTTRLFKLNGPAISVLFFCILLRRFRVRQLGDWFYSYFPRVRYAATISLFCFGSFLFCFGLFFVCSFAAAKDVDALR